MENLEYIQGWKRDLVTNSFLWVHLSCISPQGQYQTLTPYKGDCKKILVDVEMLRWLLIGQDHKETRLELNTFCTWSDVTGYISMR